MRRITISVYELYPVYDIEEYTQEDQDMGFGYCNVTEKEYQEFLMIKQNFAAYQNRLRYLSANYKTFKKKD